MRRTTAALGAAALSASLLATGGPASASAPVPPRPGSEIGSTSEGTWDLEGLDQQLIDRFDRYVKTSPHGDFVLVVPASVAKHHRRDIAIVAAAVGLANSVLAQARASQGGTTLAALTRPGGLSTHWWGVSMWLDSYATNKLLNLLWAGAGVGTIVAALEALGVVSAPAGAVSALVAGIIAVGAAAIGFCSNSRGVVIDKAWAGPPWCHGR